MNSETELEGSAQERNNAMTSDLSKIQLKGRVSKLDGWILAVIS